MKNIFKISFLFFLVLSFASADECIEGDCENGTGTYLYSTGDKSGSKFTGEWKNGKRDGKGIIVKKDGTIFEGEYKNDKANGKGTWRFSDGHKFEGEFKDGRFIIETKIFPNGNKYTGDFKNNLLEGKGTFTFSNGNKYTGEFKDNQFNEIYISTSLQECEQRDTKGLYQKVRQGEIKDFTGIDSPYEAPDNPDVMIDTENRTVDECVHMIINKVGLV